MGAFLLDLSYTCPRELASLIGKFHWQTPGYVTCHILLDKSGEIARLVGAIATVPEEGWESQVAFWFDGYLNAYYRSLKAWRRGDELGARLQCADAVMHLIRTLFILERRWTPYSDRLVSQLDHLNGQGWIPGWLHAMLLSLVREASPALQTELECRVEALLRARGFGHVIDAWGGEIERVKQDGGFH